MNETERHQVCGVLALEEVKRFIFEIFVRLGIDVQCFPRPCSEMTKRMSRVGCSSFNLKRKIRMYRVSQKNALLCFLAITPLWKGLEIKVGGVLKNSENSLSDRHQNFSI